MRCQYSAISITGRLSLSAVLCSLKLKRPTLDTTSIHLVLFGMQASRSAVAPSELHLLSNSNESFRFVRRQSIWIRLRKDEHVLGLAHLHDTKHFTATREN